MTTGIDISSSQSNISISTAKSQGIQFVIVKQGGANVNEPGYTAPYYAAQIDRCVSASMPKGHYWVIGDAAVTSVNTQADYFTSHLHNFDKTKDILALDNEPLDDNNTFWGDAHTSQFINRVISNLGIAPTQFWVYGQASLWTSGSSGPWPLTIATGCRFWVADWGNNDGTRVTPNLSAYIPSIDVQQYWSNGSIAGYTVDMNYSARSVSDLFGSWSGSGTGGTTGGTGSTTTTTTSNILSDQDRADLAASFDSVISSKIDDIALSTWEHYMASAIDGGSHYIQTYAAWSQRDLAHITSLLNGDDPAFVLAKETSSNVVYALNPQAGTKRALTADQLNVLLACSVNFKTVADASLTAFTTVTG